MILGNEATLLSVKSTLKEIHKDATGQKLYSKCLLELHRVIWVDLWHRSSHSISGFHTWVVETPWSWLWFPATQHYLLFGSECLNEMTVTKRWNIFHRSHKSLPESCKNEDRPANKSQPGSRGRWCGLNERVLVFVSRFSPNASSAGRSLIIFFFPFSSKKGQKGGLGNTLKDLSKPSALLRLPREQQETYVLWLYCGLNGGDEHTTGV